MATWSAFEAAEPAMAAVAAVVWPGPLAMLHGRPRPERAASWFEVAYLATVRPDGGPRVHPFCPVLAGGRLHAVIPRPSPKGDDLRRDPRCVVHAMPGPDDAELCIRGLAIERTGDPSIRDQVLATIAVSGVGGMAQSAAHDPIFEIELLRVDVATWVNVGQPGTHAERRRWTDST